MGVSFYAVLEYVLYDTPMSFGRINILRDDDLLNPNRGEAEAIEPQAQTKTTQ